MSKWLERGQTIFDKAVAVFFGLFGALNLALAFAKLLNAALVWRDTGSWQTEPAIGTVHIAPGQPSVFQSIINLLHATPMFVAAAVVGALFVWRGIQRWIDADVRGLKSDR